MSKDDLGRSLHDRATRGAVLSAEEQAQLDEWYAQLDQEEAALLSGNRPAPGLASLQAQVDAAVAQLVTTTQRIQTMTAENEAVRQEIAALQRRLTQKPTAQPA